MYHKVKNTLAGLSMVAAFTVGGVLFSEPVPADAATLSPSSIRASASPADRALALALVQAALAVVQTELARASADNVQVEADASETDSRAEPSPRAKSHSRLKFGMPYYSFGAVLPGRRES